LAGQTCNVAVVLDCSKYLNRVLSVDRAARTAELLGKMFGSERVSAFDEFDTVRDPDGLMNPGKVALAPLDARLWGPVTLPSYTAPRADAALLTEAARPLGIAALLLVNGLVIPLAEERLWRGAIQPRLVAACGLLPGLLATAVLFSLKHAIVDASLGRLIAITAGGLVLGVVAHRAAGPGLGRSGWPTSAVSHAVGNTVATCLAIAAGAL
jgi:membrane protease YdiL (CAAX protease family)